MTTRGSTRRDVRPHQPDMGQYYGWMRRRKTLWNPSRGRRPARWCAPGHLFSLENDSELVVSASRTGLEELRRYKVADAEPGAAGDLRHRIFVKDVSALSLWTLTNRSCPPMLPVPSF